MDNPSPRVRFRHVLIASIGAIGLLASSVAVYVVVTFPWTFRRRTIGTEALMETVVLVLLPVGLMLMWMAWSFSRQSRMTRAEYRAYRKQTKAGAANRAALEKTTNLVTRWVVFFALLMVGLFAILFLRK